MASLGVGDEYRGNRKELAEFIKKVWGVGGTVQMTSHDTVMITSLPVIQKG